MCIFGSLSDHGVTLFPRFRRGPSFSHTPPSASRAPAPALPRSRWLVWLHTTLHILHCEYLVSWWRFCWHVTAVVIIETQLTQPLSPVLPFGCLLRLAFATQVGRPVTEACLEGYNGTIFCYGQVCAIDPIRYIHVAHVVCIHPHHELGVTLPIMMPICVMTF